MIPQQITPDMMKAAIFLGVILVGALVALALFLSSMVAQRSYNNDALPVLEEYADDVGVEDLMSPEEQLVAQTIDDRPAFLLEEDYQVPSEYADSADEDAEKLLQAARGTKKKKGSILSKGRRNKVSTVGVD